MKECIDVSFGVCKIRALLNAVLVTEDPWERDSLLFVMEDVLSGIENTVAALEEEYA